MKGIILRDKISIEIISMIWCQLQLKINKTKLK